MKLLLFAKYAKKYLPFRKNLYFENPDNYLVTIDTEYGEFNLSSVMDSNTVTMTDIKEAIFIIKEILSNEHAEEDFTYWNTMCNTMNELCESDFRKKYNIIEVRDTKEWAEDQLVDLGYLSNFTPAIIKSHIDFEGVANELLLDYYYELLDNGNTLIWREN